MAHINKIWSNRKLAARLFQANFAKGCFPIQVDINVTRNCNINCSHCYAALDTVADFPEPGTADLKSIIDNVHAMGVRWIRLLGGEPLLRDDLEELIRHVKSRGIFCDITTNGLLISRRLNELKQTDALCVSVDGGRESNDFLRGEGTWKKVVAQLEIAVEAGLKPRLHGVICGYTLHAIAPMVELAGRLGLRFDFSECSLGEYPDPNFLITGKQSRDFYRRYLSAKQAGASIGNSKTTIRTVLEWPFDHPVITYEDVRRNPSIREKIPECMLGYRSGFIDVDGSLYPCTRRWKKGVSFKTFGFPAAWRKMVESRPCYSCREMAVIERTRVFKGNIFALMNAYLGFA